MIEHEATGAARKTGESDAINIQFFGSFVIEYRGKRLSNDNRRTKQLWILLEYLIVNRFNDISPYKLEDVLWSDDDTENPGNALKNLVYRLRAMLSEVGRTAEREYIVSRQGSYAWNNDLPCFVDIEEFMRLYRRAGLPDTPPDRRIDDYKQCIELYKGDFLNSLAYEEWVVPLSTYYRNIFAECVGKVSELLFEQKRYDEVDTVCTRAIAVDPFEENVHILKMRALISAGRHSQALAHYEYVTELFYKELGVKPSGAIREMYKQILKQIKDIETDLNVIIDDLREAENEKAGAYYCEYEIFKNMYRLEARSAVRTGQSVFVGLLTVTESGKHMVSTKLHDKVIEIFYDAIMKSLRLGDVVSRFSATQYIVMLPTLTVENGEMIMKRIQKRFNSACSIKTVTIEYKIMPVEPIA